MVLYLSFRLKMDNSTQSSRCMRQTTLAKSRRCQLLTLWMLKIWSYLLTWCRKSLKKPTLKRSKSSRSEWWSNWVSSNQSSKSYCMRTTMWLKSKSLREMSLLLMLKNKISSSRKGIMFVMISVVKLIRPTYDLSSWEKELLTKPGVEWKPSQRQSSQYRVILCYLTSAFANEHPKNRRSSICWSTNERLN